MKKQTDRFPGNVLEILWASVTILSWRKRLFVLRVLICSVPAFTTSGLQWPTGTRNALEIISITNGNVRKENELYDFTSKFLYPKKSFSKHFWAKYYGLKLHECICDKKWINTQHQTLSVYVGENAKFRNIMWVWSMCNFQ